MSDVSTPLAALLRAEIAQRGPIPFRDFMEQALYHPQYGYYSSGRAHLGRRGDYFTNVSVGPFFGRLLARQFAEMWERLGAPPDFALVEQGAHTGDFAADALAALRQLAPACFAATTCWLVEPLSALRAAQQARLAPFAPQVRWVAALAELPPFCGVHFSNELIDAFPVHRVVRRDGDWRERAVAFQNGGFVFMDIPFSSDALRSHLAYLPDLPPDYETEVNLAAATWLSDVTARLRAGFILAMDYGFPRAEYYRPERSSGTLSAYAEHRREPDPLARPGEIDLTAHVDFTALAEAALATGLELAGFTDQHHFMVGLGQRHFSDEVPGTPQELRAFKTLMHPDMLGRSFHALCVSRNVNAAALSGFHFAADPRRALLASQPA
jgi:SAM-dependent MidA family methyltransferase